MIKADAGTLQHPRPNPADDRIVMADEIRGDEQAVIAVIKAAENRRYVYRTRLYPQTGTYQFVSAQVEVYDTKEVLRTTQGMNMPQKYTSTSPLRSIADFIEELLTKKQQQR